MWFFSDKVKVGDSGLLEGFRDCHCHLVPDVDDGVKTPEDTLRILKKWEELGVKEVWMTPHIMEDIPNQPKELNDKIQDVLRQYTGTIKIHLASENMMDNLFLTRLGDDDLLPIWWSGKNKSPKELLYIIRYCVDFGSKKKFSKQMKDFFEGPVWPAKNYSTIADWADTPFREALHDMYEVCGLKYNKPKKKKK